MVEVEVLKIGTRKPLRTLVGFVAEKFEGRQERITSSRLKVLWADAAEFEAREARWEHVDTHPGLNDEPEEYAIDEVFRVLLDERLAEAVYRRSGATLIKNARARGLACLPRDRRYPITQGTGVA
ncbi:hypothetical protein BPSY_2243 [Bifidobacterium psychraerophilum]|uniref:Uncharacterized protein n=1 Tax=Bifidobacterium psychraerophilum TaxID=218140 RepID=A0A087CCP9_9BIFI|nr:hypothetical protein BPSY_2243 [Bifidobacterium psychraerophilum]